MKFGRVTTSGLSNHHQWSLKYWRVWKLYNFWPISVYISEMVRVRDIVQWSTTPKLYALYQTVWLPMSAWLSRSFWLICICRLIGTTNRYVYCWTVPLPMWPWVTSAILNLPVSQSIDICYILHTKLLKMIGCYICSISCSVLHSKYFKLVQGHVHQWTRDVNDSWLFACKCPSSSLDCCCVQLSVCLMVMGF